MVIMISLVNLSGCELSPVMMLEATVMSATRKRA